MKGEMAKNAGSDFRKRSVNDRTQLNIDKKNDKFVKRDTATGEFNDIKKEAL